LSKRGKKTNKPKKNNFPVYVVELKKKVCDFGYANTDI
jgi:hypothetical protein